MRFHGCEVGYSRLWNVVGVRVGGETAPNKAMHDLSMHVPIARFDLAADAQVGIREVR